MRLKVSVSAVWLAAALSAFSVEEGASIPRRAGKENPGGSLREPEEALRGPAPSQDPPAVDVKTDELRAAAEESAEALFQAGEEMVRARDLDGAKARYMSVVRDYPDSPRVALAGERIRQIEQFQARTAEWERQIDAARTAAEEHQARIEQDRREAYIALWQKYDRDLRAYERSRRQFGRSARRPTPPAAPRPPEGDYPDRRR